MNISLLSYLLQRMPGRRLSDWKRPLNYDKDPWKSRNLRVLPVDNYCVFYIPDNNNGTVTVIRVIYGGRNIEEQLEYFTKDIKED